MSNLFNDPFGLKLMKCNRPPKEQEAVSEEPKDNQESYYYCYPTFQPYYQINAGSQQMVMVQQQFIPYHFPHQFYYTSFHPFVAQVPTKSPQCENCKKNKKAA